MSLLLYLIALQLSPALRQMADTELAFSDLCAKVGVKQSFTKYFAEDGIMFVPGPVNARRFFAKQPDRKPTAQMTWKPAEGAVSKDGSMGYEYGPVTIKRPNKPPQTTSVFFSVWKKTPEGYRVVLDFGCAVADAKALLAQKDFVEIPIQRPLTDDGGQKRTAEDALMRDVEHRRWQRAVEDRMSAKAICLRPGLRAGAGLASWDSIAKPVPLRWERLGSGSADSGDLAYTYGSIAWHQERAFGQSGEVAGHYARVWRKDYRGHWYLAADVTNPDK
jgi:ketosteroid isomerase-like protein